MFARIATIASLPIVLIVARLVPFDRGPAVCAFYRVTGLPCPTCGLTRSIAALVHFDVPLSVTMNPLGIPVLGLFALWWGVASYQVMTRRQTRVGAWASRRALLLWAVGLGIVLALGILRIAHLVAG